MQGEVDLKRFEKLKRLSKGGFGFVYQVQEKKTGQLYAAKVIDCDDNEGKCNEMVNREISILIYATHPTIVKFIGYSKVDFQGENNVTIIMELAKNGSLREVLRKIQQGCGPSNYTNTTRQIILVGVARGIKYLHDRNIIHRDIKPENILLDENFQPHITDFGLSKFYEVGQSNNQTKFGGTLSYEAPEILKQQKYNGKVDVYSFSILMYEVLTDSVPYPEIEGGKMSEYDFMNKIINKSYRPQFLTPIKDSLRELIEQCWSENPDDRPTFDEIFRKLANKTGNEEEKDFLLEDVDTTELNIYVEDVTKITDSTEKLLRKISELEEENKQLKSQNDNEQADKIEKLEENNRQLKSRIEELEAENKKLLNSSRRENEEQVKVTEENEAKIIVAGNNRYNILCEKTNNKDEFDTPITSPPLNSSIDSSSLLSYSFYSYFSVLVTRGGSLLGIGNNSNGIISSSLEKTEITQLTEFLIKDENGTKLTPISVVCSSFGTLYMFSKSNGNGKQLVYCSDSNGGDPVFLDIGDEEPVALFGGCSHCAVITDKGEVIFINYIAVKDSPNSRLVAISLPDGEKASSVACLSESIFVLSLNGHVFSSFLKELDSNVVNFSRVSELSAYEIVWLSGTEWHCLAVNKEGQVFGYGSNDCGRLGFDGQTESVSSFTEISSLSEYKIRAAYAGFNYSLFETKEGKVLSCGYNGCGELLLSSGPSDESVYLPRETVITKDARFCIAGMERTAVFVASDPPTNTPNMPIKHDM